MTKKDFELIAYIISEIFDKHRDRTRNGQQIAKKFAEMLAEKYPKFNKFRFMGACINPQCPECKQEVWDIAKGSKLNKCWNCGLAFDNESITEF